MGNWMPQEKVTLINCPEKPWEASRHDCLLAVKYGPDPGQWSYMAVGR